MLQRLSSPSSSVIDLRWQLKRKKKPAHTQNFLHHLVESFFSSLKKERIKKRIYKTRDLARADLFDYIEVFYNRQRRHSHLGGVSPEAFEQASF